MEDSKPEKSHAISTETLLKNAVTITDKNIDILLQKLIDLLSPVSENKVVPLTEWEMFALVAVSLDKFDYREIGKMKTKHSQSKKKNPYTWLSFSKRGTDIFIRTVDSSIWLRIGDRVVLLPDKQSFFIERKPNNPKKLYYFEKKKVQPESELLSPDNS